jgi:hypothetical protein
VVVVDAPAAPGVPVLGHRDLRVGLAVGQRVVEVGGVAHGVWERGAVDEPPLCRREDDLKGGAGRHHGKVLVEDGPPLLGGFVPHTYVVAVGGARLLAPTGRRLGEDDGVGVAVDAGVGQVGVVAAAVRAGGGVDEGGLLAGLFAGVGAFGALRRLRDGPFIGGLRICGATSDTGARGPLIPECVEGQFNELRNELRL